jgi:hypothetical protein
MIAYYFRVIGDNGEPTGHMGFAMATTKKCLFWEIDQFVNPHRVEIKIAQFASYCKHVEVFDDGEDYDEDVTEFDFGWSEPLLNQDGWKKPNWEGCGV